MSNRRRRPQSIKKYTASLCAAGTITRLEAPLTRVRSVIRQSPSPLSSTRGGRENRNAAAEINRLALFFDIGRLDEGDFGDATHYYRPRMCVRRYSLSATYDITTFMVAAAPFIVLPISRAMMSRFISFFSYRARRRACHRSLRPSASS